MRATFTREGRVWKGAGEGGMFQVGTGPLQVSQVVGVGVDGHPYSFQPCGRSGLLSTVDSNSLVSWNPGNK